MQTAGVVHVPADPEPVMQSLFSHCELELQLPPSARSMTQVGVADDVSQNVSTSKQRWPVVQAWPVDGPFVHFIAVVSHG